MEDPSIRQRIADLAKANDLRVVVELLPFLPPRSSPYSAAAADAVRANVHAATPDEVASFDAWYRQRTCSGPERPSWDRMRVDLLEQWVLEAPAVVAIATVHHSGFIREKALVALEECHDGTELPFLLVRLNDWVASVRFVAARAVRARLNVDYAAHWVRSLGLLERIQLGGRSDHAWLRAPVESLLRRDESRAVLERGLTSGSLLVRRACLRIAAGLADPRMLLHIALRDGDPVTSGGAAETLCRLLEGEALREVLAVLQQGNARARGLALETICAKLPQEAEPFLRGALLDPTSSVRELARFKAHKLGLAPADFAPFYRKQLGVQRGERFVTALRGLAETGTVEDVPSFVEYAADRRALVREAAILGLGRCDGKKQVERLVAALDDTNLRVAKAAHRYAKLYLGRGAVPKRKRRA